MNALQPLWNDEELRQALLIENDLGDRGGLSTPSEISWLFPLWPIDEGNN